jgi:hypothetical protein
MIHPFRIKSRRTILFAALSCTMVAMQISGCSEDAELTQARKRISELEAELATARASAKPGIAADGAAAAPAPAAPETPAAAPPDRWHYSVSEEKMTGGQRFLATIESTNTVNFDFPYNGSQNGSLILRTDPRHGKDLMFQIQKGQIMCPSYQGCTVQVRFDDEKPVSYSANGPADNSSEVIFLSDYAQFLGKLKKAKRVRLSVNIFQEGAPVFEFDVAGFSADKYLGKK